MVVNIEHDVNMSETRHDVNMVVNIEHDVNMVVNIGLWKWKLNSSSFRVHIDKTKLWHFVLMTDADDAEIMNIQRAVELPGAWKTWGQQNSRGGGGGRDGKVFFLIID